MGDYKKWETNMTSIFGADVKITFEDFLRSLKEHSQAEALSDYNKFLTSYTKWRTDMEQIFGGDFQ